MPFGHMGGDGWSLTYYYAWASSAEIPTTIWNDVSVKILDTFDTFDRPPDGGGCAASADGEGSSPPNHSRSNGFVLSLVVGNRLRVPLTSSVLEVNRIP